MNKRSLFLCTSFILFTVFAFTAKAEIAIIVNKSNTNEISPTLVTNIFLGKIESYPNNDLAIPLNHEPGAIRDRFNKAVLKRSRTQLRVYWSKMLFTGNARMPQEVADNTRMIKLIKNNNNAIGYVNLNKDVTQASLKKHVRIVTIYP